MQIKRDVPVGVLFFVISLFPMALAMHIAKVGFVEWVMIFFCFSIYDRLSTYAFAKMLGINDD